MFSKFSYGGSSVKVWDTNALHPAVLNIPTLYKAARPVLRIGLFCPFYSKTSAMQSEYGSYTDLIIDRPEDSCISGTRGLAARKMMSTICAA